MSNYVLTPSAVRKLRGALAMTPGNGGAGGAPSPVSPDIFPAPFTVRWSVSENSGSGAWVIWLPNVAALVSTGPSQFVTITTGISASQVLPSGWYVLDTAAFSQNATAVWLVVQRTESSGVWSASILDAPSTTTSSYTYYNYRVATMSRNATTGAIFVKQFLQSIVTIGDAGLSPDNVSTELIPQPAQGATPDGDEGKLQIKGFKAGAPTSQTSLGTDLQSSGTAGGHVLFREPDGTISYKAVGHVAGGATSGITGIKTIVTGVAWDSVNHYLVISTATATFAAGVCTAWTDNAPTNISTTAISSIIGS